VRAARVFISPKRVSPPIYTHHRGGGVGNTKVLRNRTTDRKQNFNAVCHLVMTNLALRICTAAFPALLRLSCLLPKSVTTLAPTCPGPYGGHIYKLDQPWPEHRGPSGPIISCDDVALRFSGSMEIP
jgi:hypothetical protein